MQLLGRVFLLGFLLFAALCTKAEEIDYASDSRIEIPVVIYITSLYDLDIPEKKFTISAWIWSTYDPKLLPEDYKFYNKINVVMSHKCIHPFS